MKKAAVLSIAAFYLLLTTGMYVCILHCTAEYFVQPKVAMHDDCDEAHEGKDHKPCIDKEGCDCCKKHGTYAIKENVKPPADFQTLQFVVTINQPVILNNIRENPAEIHRHGMTPTRRLGNQVKLFPFNFAPSRYDSGNPAHPAYGNSLFNFLQELE